MNNIQASLLSISFNGSCPDDLKHGLTECPQDGDCDVTLTASTTTLLQQVGQVDETSHSTTEKFHCVHVRPCIAILGQSQRLYDLGQDTGSEVV